MLVMIMPEVSTVQILYLIHGIVVLLQLPAMIDSFETNEASDILHLCERNGKRNVNFFTLDQRDPYVQVALQHFMNVAKRRSHVYSRKVVDPDFILNSVNFHKDSLIVLASSANASNWQTYLEIMTQTKIMSSIIVMTKELNLAHIKLMVSHIERLAKNSFFYWIYKAENSNHEMIWSQVLTVDHYTQAVINNLKFNRLGIIVEEYDMQGMNLVSTELSFPPYLTYLECNGGNRECKTSGYLVDAMDIFAKTMNFTWESHQDTSNDWGAAPISGPANTRGNGAELLVV